MTKKIFCSDLISYLNRLINIKVKEKIKFKIKYEQK